MVKVILVIHNVRSCYNVGSLLRTAEGLGVELVYMSGFTPYPEHKNDRRLPHIRQRATQQITKTALGAEKSVQWKVCPEITTVLKDLRKKNWRLTALEQAKKSVPLTGYYPPGKVALVVGNEIGGIDNAVLSYCDDVIEIPMSGRKESFNVAAAAAIALYHLKFLPLSLDKQSFKV